MSDWHYVSVLFLFMMLDFLILTLATWRISSLIATPGDDGPWEMFLKFRNLVGVKLDEETGIYYGTNVFSEGIICVFCVSIWVGLGLGTMYLIWGNPAVYFSFPFALSAGAIIAERIVNG